ncbi:histidine phosphatase family protein [Nakamurella antarctica]|uniref:Histidine phosphatase family protein n=1 Tax=Nakamurella antarctica TaxID=1902245 RepID=A0A3G8ZKI1_9ACTN|nr:histidine phosphatase family protein [Nakamurella antarctica]AZI57763.1 histidine phosphatase family protein [Nakamurella antarctica]
MRRHLDSLVKSARVARAADVTSLLIVRHGQTTWGAQGRFVGRTDIELTGRGIRQAKAVGHRLLPMRPDLVVSSPLLRCRVTADAIVSAAGVAHPVLVHDGLIDGELGEWTGMSADDIEQRYPEQFAAWRSDADAAPPGGESFADIRRRITATVCQLVEENRGKVLVLTTHAAPSKMVVMWGLGAPTEVAYRIRVDNASVTGIDVDAENVRTVWTVNDTGHLMG